MNLKLTMENLNKNGIETYFVEKKTDVVNKLSEFIKPTDTVGVGGSMTLDECGVLDFLRKSEFNFLDRYESGADANKINLAANSADVFLCSSNAVTEDGLLYNVDGNANRISSIAHGPKTVLMVVGINKIVKNLDAAIFRVKTVAAPKNCARLNCNTYCNKTGKCQSLLHENSKMTDGCSGDSRICCNYLVSAHQRKAGRIKVIFVNEPLGY